MATGENENILKVSAFIIFAFSGLFFILGCALAYHLLIDHDLISIIKSVSPLIAASIVSLYLGFVILYAHRKEKYTRKEINKKIALYFVLIFIGSVLFIVGFTEEIWGVCSIGFILVSASLIETYKIMRMKDKNVQK